MGDWVWELVASARGAAEKAGEIIREAMLETTRLVEHDEQLICEVTSGAHGYIELADEPTWVAHDTTNFVQGFLFGCISIGLTMSNEHFMGICGKGGFLMENPKNGLSSTKELTSFLHETEVTSFGGWISFDFNACGVTHGNLHICFHLGYGGCWDVADAVNLREDGGVMYDSEVALLCYPFAYCM